MPTYRSAAPKAGRGSEVRTQKMYREAGKTRMCREGERESGREGERGGERGRKRGRETRSEGEKEAAWKDTGQKG
eukprot:765896-Hanusia_phi.AAC.1